MHILKNIKIVLMMALLVQDIGAFASQCDVPTSPEYGAVVLAQAKDAIAQAHAFFTVRGKIKKFKKAFEEYDTSFAVVGAVGAMLLATSIVTQTGRECWQAFGSNIVSMVKWLCGDGAFVAVPLLVLVAGVVAFVIINNYTASAYCWAGISMMETAIDTLQTDDFYTHDIPSNRIRAYVLINFNSIVDAVNRYRDISRSLNCAQELISKALNNTKNEALSKQCRVFLDLIRKIEQLLETKLQALYQEMGQEYQQQLAQKYKEQMQEKLEQKIEKASAAGSLQYNINEHVVVK